MVRLASNNKVNNSAALPWGLNSVVSPIHAGLTVLVRLFPRRVLWEAAPMPRRDPPQPVHCFPTARSVHDLTSPAVKSSAELIIKQGEIAAHDNEC